MADRPFVLFYSKYCEHSIKIIGLINDCPLKTKTVKICVDDKPRSVLPATVQAVPTLIDMVRGDVHVGDAIFTVLMRGPGNGMQQQPQQQPTQQQQQPRQDPRFAPPSSTGQFPEILAVNHGDSHYAPLSGDANVSALDESFKSISDHIGNAAPSVSSSAKNNGIENKFEQMMAERQKEAMGQQRQRT